MGGPSNSQSSVSSNLHTDMIRDVVGPTCFNVVKDVEDFKEKSKQNSQNRRSEPDGESTGMSRHTGRSRSSIKHRKVMSQELGQEVKKESTPTSQRAACVITNVEADVDERRASTHEKPDIDEIYTSDVPKKKSRIFGTNSLGKTFGGFSYSSQSTASTPLTEARIQKIIDTCVDMRVSRIQKIIDTCVDMRVAALTALTTRLVAEIEQLKARLPPSPPPSP